MIVDNIGHRLAPDMSASLDIISTMPVQARQFAVEMTARRPDEVDRYSVDYEHGDAIGDDDDPHGPGY